MKKIVLLTAYCSLLTSPCFGSGYEFEGVGARQTARAGAAVADSDDWTAIYWNPANLAKASQTKKREIGLELFGGMAYGKDSNSLSNIPGVGAIFSKEKLSSPFILGAIGGVLPVGEKMGLGLGFYTPLLQGSDFEDTSPSGVRLNLKNSAAVLLWTASSGLQMTPELALGAGLNVMYGKITTKINLVSPIDTNTSDLSADGWGVEGMLGLRYDPHPKLSLGFAYRT
ncbi:MAG: outer membrane protein transport protein, partial [Elusimicrobia bacterium]|nr:outer membrane protein transport protein [Elusimicrobiota bacterium]